MALIKCPECGRENVSSNAAACPGCGFNIKDSFINNLESTDGTVNEDNDESAGGVTSVKAEANGDIHIKKSDSIKIGKKQLIICLGVVAAIIILILGIKINYCFTLTNFYEEQLGFVFLKFFNFLVAV